MPKPPNRMRHSTSIPSACQKVIGGQPNSAGVSQFHRDFTISPPMVMNNAIPSSASGAMNNILIHLGLMFGPSSFQFVINLLQPFAQVEHRVPFAREQRVHAHARLGSELLEAASFELVRHE